MTGTLQQFALVYANPQNIFLLGALCILLLLVLRLITASRGLRDFKRIIRILRQEDPDDILPCIEKLRLSRRFAEMWEDYYDAFCAEDTVTLSEYLLTSDLSVPTHLCRNLSRAVAALSFAGAFASVLFVPGLKEHTYLFLLCSSFMAAYLLPAEACFALVEALRERRLRRLTEEFRQLSLRKLPGRAVDFSQRYLLQATDRVLGELRETRAALTQINARLDRQYHTLITMKNEPSEEKET